MRKIEVPIWEKAALTVDEAAAYSNIGVNKIYAMLKKPNCAFVIHVGGRKLIKRKEFEKYLANQIYI